MHPNIELIVFEPISRTRRERPGVILAIVITSIALVIAEIKAARLGHAVLRRLVLEYIFGLVLQASWTSPEALDPGITHSGEQLLEIAIVVLGRPTRPDWDNEAPLRALLPITILFLNEGGRRR